MKKISNMRIILCTLLAFFSVQIISAQETYTYDVLMPNVWPYKNELYLCTPIRISPEDDFYIVGFEPKASMHTAHHMLLFGCSHPGTNDPVWSCGEMQNDEINDKYKTANPCDSGSQIVYAWARDAPSLHLPDKVGFLVGKNSPIKYLVLQVHYMSKFPMGQTDNSGVILHYTRHRMLRQAGIILLGTAGMIQGSQMENMETACRIVENKTIHPFAFRTHTHSLGTLVSGYAVRPSGNKYKWSLIGKKNPQLPQMFYPVTDNSTIREGDILAARCTMHNTHEYTVTIGATNKNEMCNFYLMYWVEGTAPLKQKYCFSRGPPYYYWFNGEEDFSNSPRLEK